MEAVNFFPEALILSKVKIVPFLVSTYTRNPAVRCGNEP